MKSGIKSLVEALSKTHPALSGAYKNFVRERYLRGFVSAGPSKRGSGKKFLIVDHCYGLDAEALCAAETNHELWVINPFAVFTNATDYFPPGQRDLECVYGEGPMAETVERYRREFIVPLVDRLIREIGVEIFLIPSDTFYWVRAMIDEFHSRGIPTVVQDKEGTLSEGTMLSSHPRILAERYPPISDRYYFWNENQRRFWTKVGIDLEKVSVLGQPRSDFFFHPDRWPKKSELGLDPDKKLITAFTFDADAYSGEMHVGRGVSRYPWTDLRAEFHAVLRRIVRERDDVQVVVKAHPQQLDLGDVREEFAKNATPRMTLMTGANSASHLIVRSEVVVGFQTTAMIEAMLTPAPVIYAGWGKAHEILDAEMLPIHHSGGCLTPRNADELYEQILSALDGKERPDAQKVAARKSFCDRYFFDANGMCGVRVLEAAAAFLTGYRASNVKAVRG